MDYFVIMAFNRSDTEKIWRDVFCPVVEEFASSPPIKIDVNSKGYLLQAEIFEGIKNSKIILCDLTYERPNCYFEAGYAMGLGKFTNLVITCREDHNLYKRERKADDPIVHFDLNCYPIIWWNENEIDKFKCELRKRIQYRLSQLPPPLNVDNSEMHIARRFIHFIKKLLGAKL